MAKVQKKLRAWTIVRLREELGFSQRVFGEELAKIHGLDTPFTRGYISNLENGKQRITDEIEKSIYSLFEFAHDPQTALIKKAISHRPGRVALNSIYGGSSKLCKWGDCDNDFIPTSPNQKQCPSCKQRKRKPQENK